MNKIKKFVIYNIILSFILIGTLYSLSWVWSNYKDENNIKFFQLEKQNIKNLKIISLGSSHTYYGIKYPLNIKGYNLGLPSQNFYYDQKILFKYENKLDKNAIVIIPISIFSFYSSFNTEEIDKNYVSILNKKDILHLKNTEWFLLKYFSITQPFNRIFKIITKHGILQYHENYTFDKMKTDSLEATKRHLKENNSKIDIQLLCSTLNFIKKRGYRVILITTPYTELYNIAVGENNFQKRIYENIKKIENILGKNFLYLDYSHDKRFVNNLEYFMDSDHLNEKGAEYFTKILLEDIKNKGYNFN